MAELPEDRLGEKILAIPLYGCLLSFVIGIDLARSIRVKASKARAAFSRMLHPRTNGLDRQISYNKEGSYNKERVIEQDGRNFLVTEERSEERTGYSILGEVKKTGIIFRAAERYPDYETPIGQIYPGRRVRFYDYKQISPEEKERVKENILKVLGEVK